LVVKVELAGMRSEHREITVEGNRMRIAGNRPDGCRYDNVHAEYRYRGCRDNDFSCRVKRQVCKTYHFPNKGLERKPP
jgi:HSP20 family molecular chaperone IbpA